MDGSIKAILIGGVIFTGLLVAIGVGINMAQSSPEAVQQRESFADLQRQQLQMARQAMQQAKQMQQAHQQHMQMMQAEMMGEFGEYDGYATGGYDR